jgi:hypothetical protein
MVNRPDIMNPDGAGSQTIAALVRNLIGAINNTNLTKNGIVLASGQLPDTKGTLYTVPVGNKAKVTFLSLANVSVGAEVPILYLKPGADSRAFFKKSLAANTSEIVIGNGTVLDLEQGDIIEGETDNAAAVDYVITGTLIVPEG